MSDREEMTIEELLKAVDQKIDAIPKAETLEESLQLYKDAVLLRKKAEEKLKEYSRVLEEITEDLP